MKRLLSSLAVVSALLMLPSVALADVVGPPQMGCIEGSEGASCHGGPYCALRDCMTDTDCVDGFVCQDRPLCIDSIGCAGLLPPDADPNDYKVPTVEGACPSGNECAAPAVCETRKVCVASSSSSSSSSSTSSSGASSSSSSGSPGDDAGCSCRVGSMSSSAPLALGLSCGALLFALSRRERRDRDRQGKPRRQRRS